MGRHTAEGMDEALEYRSTAALLLPSPRWSEQDILSFYRFCR